MFPSIGPALGVQTQAGAEGDSAAESAMGAIRDTSMTQMRMQSEMGILKMLTSLNEALAKLFKALGDAVKGLA